MTPAPVAWLIASLRSGWTALVARNRLLAGLALGHALLFLGLLVLMLIEDRELLGVDLWTKPARFALSIAVYLATLGWLLGELSRPRWLITLVTCVVAASMCLEQALITLQSARGTTSHYNTASSFDAAVFSLMGFGVAANSAVVAAVLGLFLVQEGRARPAYLLGIRTGLVLFLLGSAQGFVMIRHAAHTIGAPDGGDGLPFLGWSTQFGDLRVAHFLGIHALQVLPVAGWLADRLLRSRGAALATSAASASAYALFFANAQLAALDGRPAFPG